MRSCGESHAQGGRITSVRFRRLRLSTVVLVATCLIACMGILPGCSPETGQTDQSSAAAGTERLLGDLYSADIYTRTEAAAALGRQKEAQAVDPLIEYLKDGMDAYSGYTAREEIVFLQTVIAALGEIGDERAVEPLLDIHKSAEDRGIRFGASARDALIMIGESAIEPLIASMEGENTDYTRRVIGMLGKIGGERAVGILAGYLDDPDLGYDAVAALGDTGESSAVPYLEECLNNDYGLTSRAAEALGKIGTPEAERALIAALHNPDAETLSGVPTALGSFKNRDAIDALIAARAKVEYTHVVDFGSELDRVLIAMGADAVEPLLLRLGEHDEQNDRPWLLYILGAIRDARAVAPLIAIMRDEGDECRGNAAETLGKIGDESAVGPLIDTMLDYYSAGRRDFDSFGWDVAKALGSIGNEQAVSALLSALDSYHEVYTRMEIADAVSMVDDPRCVGRLEKALEEKDLTVVAGVIEYYIRLGKEGSEETLIATLKDFYYTTAVPLYSSGNETLKQAALDWAGENGYVFRITGFGPSAAWGSGG
ncbi:MAG: HEAT repeat domain-containing protein [Bacillota bacterium]